MEKQNFDISQPQHSQETDSPLAEVDFGKLLKVIKGSLPWLIVIMLVCNVFTFLIVRYTKPVYESSTELKLDIKQEASNLLGFGSLPDNYNNISGEIELLKSKLLFSRVISSMDLDVTYRTSYGSILNEERYHNCPFAVDYIIKNNSFYDRNFHIELIDQEQFKISYNLGNSQIEQIHKYGQKIINRDFEFTVFLTPHYTPGSTDNTYEFTINSKQSLVNYLTKNISVRPVNLTARTIRITFRDHNKYKARDIVNQIANLYLEYTLEEKNKANTSQIHFLDEQLQQTTAKLEKYEQYFEDFIINNKTTNLQTNIKESITFLIALDSQQAVIRQKIGLMNEIEKKVKQDSLMPDRLLLAGELNPAIANELKTLSQLLTDRQILLASYKPNTFAYKRQQKQINLLKDKILALIDESQRQGRDHLNSLAYQKNKMEERFFQLPSKSTEYTKAQRQHNLYLEFYLSLMQKKAELEIAQAGTFTNYVILSPANVPNTPVTPKKFIIYAIGGGIGLLLSFLFIIIKYLAHNKITSANELERLLAMPLLGNIPAHKYANGHSELIVHNQPKSILSESFRSIRTNLDFLHNRKERIISITSTVSGEGKTFLVANLGAILALSGQKVIILDLDLRKPKIHLAFNHEESVEGMSTLLIKKSKLEECIRSTELQDMDYIPAGTIPPNPAELIMSRNFDRLIRKLQDRYDTIIIDTPPAGLVTDPLIIMKKADIPIYVVRAEFSRKSFLKSLNRLRRVNGFDNISVILNATRSSAGYGYGYSYYEKSGYFEEKKSSFNILKKS